MKVLVLDVGGTHVKMLMQHHAKREFSSGKHLSPKRMVDAVKKQTRDWSYDAISIGYPGVVVHNRIAAEPNNLARGWVKFDFAKKLGKPVRIVNDAAMQAFGSYRGKRMLFLGLGTGLGSAMIVAGNLEPMELGHLPYKKHGNYEDYIGARGLKRLGEKKWRKQVIEVIARLRAALEPDYVVVGGGNAALLRHLPKKVYIGGNEHALAGGEALWKSKPVVGGTQ